MSEGYAVLPCNGLDRTEGQMAREVALQLISTGGELVCPVLFNRAPARYTKIAEQLPLFVIDGCPTRCASHLASDQGLKIVRRIQIAEELKAAGHGVEDALMPGSEALAFCRALAARLLSEDGASAEAPAAATPGFDAPVEYESFTYDKYLFRVPAAGYHFNENDCWARVAGSRCRVGISDYVQQQLSDIIFCHPPELGAKVEQFGEAGTVDSTKATFEIVSPVTGTVVAVNAEAAAKPELLNEDPYERGWVAELELADFASDRELLLDCCRYLEILKEKVKEF